MPTPVRPRRVFPHLWALATADRDIRDRTQRIDIAERAMLAALIADFMLATSPGRLEALMLSVQATIGGLALFLGLDRRSDGRFRDPAARMILMRNTITSDLTGS